VHGRGGSLHKPDEFQIRSPVESGGAPPHSKTLARWLRALKIRQEKANSRNLAQQQNG